MGLVYIFLVIELTILNEIVKTIKPKISFIPVVTHHFIISLNNVSKSNLDALCTDDEIVIHTPNFKSQEVYLLTEKTGEISISLTKPSVSFGGSYQSIVCCVNAKDIDACAFSLEDEKCARYIVRNAH